MLIRSASASVRVMVVTSQHELLKSAALNTAAMSVLSNTAGMSGYDLA